MSFSFDLKFEETMGILLNSINGISTTRTLIYNLATSGKLAPQLTNELHSQDLLDSVDRFQVAHESVAGWLILNLGDCAEIFNGISTSASEKAMMERNQFGLNYIATKDVGYGFQPIEYNTGLRIGDKDKDFKIAPVNSVLICLEGGSAGKKMGLVKKEIAFGNKLFAVVPNKWLEPKYLLIYFLSSSFQRDFRNQMSGIIGGISKAKFSNIQIPLPPIDEQNRIVSIVEKLISICDDLEEKKRKISLIGELSCKSAVDAISTAQSQDEFEAAWNRIQQNWDVIVGNPESISSLRQLLIDLAIQGQLFGQQPIGDNGFPNKWEVSDFESIGDIEGGNQPPKSVFISEPREGYVRLFQIRDLGSNPVPVFIPKELAKSTSVDGEILIGRYGASVGKIFKAKSGAYNVALVKFIYPKDKLESEFVYWTLKSSRSQALFTGMSRSAQAGFNKRDLAPLLIPMPSLGEQQKIVEKLNSLMAICDQLETLLLKTSELGDKFARSVVSNPL